ncbi:MAG: DRTGG domain-containing protein [Clostridiales bacterium]|nr:DRTGG domain-containing protein [Clostridiales bacterium]
MTKHEEILKYIENYEVGCKISVRMIANKLNVSEGTAYRAIKDAESNGIVSTIPRVGTVRIVKIDKKSAEALTYKEVANIVGGTILGGREGLSKHLNKFIIGAMTVDAMKKYISPGNLLIVGNREEAFKLALENGCAVLITGGFGCSNNIKELANTKKLPIISSSYDTFTIATMINKAISERLIKKDIILVGDIMNPDPVYLYSADTIKAYRELTVKTKYDKFPVLDDRNRVVGIISSKDIGESVKDHEQIGKVMTKNPVTVGKNTSAAYASHIMVWDGLELIPVVENKRLVGVIGRTDIMKALESMSKQTHLSKTFDDMIIKSFQCGYFDDGIILKGKIVPEMYSSTGSVSSSILMMLMSIACTSALKHKNHNIFPDSFVVYSIKPIPLESEISIKATVIGSGKNFAKVDADIYGSDGSLYLKGMMSVKIMKCK